MGRTSQITNEQRDRIKLLYSQGLKLEDIAEQLGISRSAVWYWTRTRIAHFEDSQLVDELRRRGYEVSAKKIIEL